MTIVEILMLLLIAAIAGSIGQAIAGYSMGGCLVSAGVGLIGALLGTWLATRFGLSEILVIQIGDQPFPVVWAIIGATLFTLIVGLITRPRAPPL